jgi:hypothetical protein
VTQKRCCIGYDPRRYSEVRLRAGKQSRPDEGRGLILLYRKKSLFNNAITTKVVTLLRRRNGKA